MHKGKGEGIHKRMWITSCGYTLENVNFPGWGNSLKCKFPHMRIYSYYCEFPLVEVHSKMCNSAVWIFTKFSELPHACGDTLFHANSLMRKSVLPHADIHEKRCISQDEEIHQTFIFRIWGFTLIIVNFHFWKCTQKCVYPLCGFTHFFGVSPHALIHQKMCISAVRIYTFFGVFPHAEIHSLMWMSTWGNVYFRGRGFAQF